MSSSRSDEPKAAEEGKPPIDPKAAPDVDDEPSLPGVTVYSDLNRNSDPPLAVDGLVGPETEGPVAAGDPHDAGWVDVVSVSPPVYEPGGSMDPPPSGDPSAIASPDDANAETYLTWELENVQITSLDINASGNDEVEPPDSTGPATLGTEGDGGGEEALHVELTNVMVTSYQVNASGNDEATGVPIAGDWDGGDDLLLAELEPSGELTRTGVAGDPVDDLDELVEGGGLDEMLDL